MMHQAVATVLALCIITIPWSSGHVKQTSFGYGRRVLLDLCQFVGVKYIRNPDSPECGYIACWDNTPYHMPCAPGLKVHQLFFWGGSYPCTEADTYNRCKYVKDFMMGDKGNRDGVTGKQGLHVRDKSMTPQMYESFDKSKVKDVINIRQSRNNEKDIRAGYGASDTRRRHESVHGAGDDLYETPFPTGDKHRPHSANHLHETRSHADYHGEGKAKPNSVLGIEPIQHSRRYPRRYRHAATPTNPYSQQRRPQYAPENRIYFKTRSKPTSTTSQYSVEAPPHSSSPAANHDAASEASRTGTTVAITTLSPENTLDNAENRTTVTPFTASSAIIDVTTPANDTTVTGDHDKLPE